MNTLWALQGLPLQLLQDGQKTDAKAEVPAPAAGPADGGVGAAPPPNPLGSLLLPILLCVVVFYFLLWRPGRRSQHARDAMMKNLKKGDTVVTTAGIIGRVFRLEDREVLLQLDKDSSLKVRFLRSAIHEVLPSAKAGEAEASEGKADAEPSREASKSGT
jgi:preprotein translocase subunit YajC